ncbi:hypothetical protein MSG28_000668 [Choristoneura fumiferana]|uniref:Uncharacterized protein n=1 Tax=Choristoneura fumiferana TaxID=7141 RepID=A0ACC0K1X4_CHOFU|nr:hypothetical protein MSG28_000668 [Choristoneura fumiferana]
METKEKESKSPIKGDFVVVNYEGEKFPGQILRMYDKETKNPKYVVKTMTISGFVNERISKKGGSGRNWLRGRRSISEGGSSMCHSVGQVRVWGVKEVQAWLETLQLGEYSDAFAKHDVTGRELLSLARRDLRDIGVTKVGHVKRILQAVKELQ